MAGRNSTEVSYGFGQHGSGHVKADTAVYAPTGKVIVAITMLENVKFNASGLIADTSFHKATTAAGLEDGVSYFGTQTQTLANGEDNDGDAVTSVAITNAVEFPKGLTVYGRWNTIQLSTSYTHGVIFYFGPK